jgi:CBS domain-containing protein
VQSLVVAGVDQSAADDLSLSELIAAASDLPRLSQAAAHITRLIGRMHRSGTRVSLMAKLVQQLNAQLFEGAWRLIAPDDLVANSCLFVMGSEGRAEQLLKTDQDNGLILRDGYPPPADLAAICQRFSDALRDFGYPDCPGGIMVSNPDWCKCLSEFAEMTHLWLLQPGPDSLMKLAIFMDAHAICGDETLLQDLRHGQMRFGTDNDPMLARFASAIDTFGSSNGWWNRLLGLDNAERMNLKKEGIFPLVHGIRSLALAHQVMATGTVERIEALVSIGKLPAELGTDLTDSLHAFMGLKLQAGLAELDAGRPVSGAIDVARLSSLDREVLKFALGIARKLRALLHLRFRLDIL